MVKCSINVQHTDMSYCCHLGNSTMVLSTITSYRVPGFESHQNPLKLVVLEVPESEHHREDEYKLVQSVEEEGGGGVC